MINKKARMVFLSTLIILSALAFSNAARAASVPAVEKKKGESDPEALDMKKLMGF